MNLLLLKISTLGVRLVGYFPLFPLRFTRIWKHFKLGGSTIFGQKSYANYPVAWWTTLGFHLLDLMAVPELYESTIDIFKWSARPLHPYEIAIARSVFGNAIPLEKVRIDEKARIACRSMNIAYVSFFTINTWGKFRPEILIHELVHVWQYLQHGSVYIPCALHAQGTKEGYNYGGVEALSHCIRQGGSLQDFNFEQQADIISDYYCIREGIRPRWGNACKDDLPVYEHFIHEIIGSHRPNSAGGKSGLSSK